MTDEIRPGDAEPTITAESTNLSLGELVKQRLSQEDSSSVEETLEDSVEKGLDTTEEVEEGTEEVPEGISEETETPSEEDVLSQLDFDNLSEEELRELSKKLGSRAVARFGELTAKFRTAEERVAELEALMQKEANPLESKQNIKDNPYRDIETVEALQEKYDEVNSAIEWAEDLLFENNEMGPEDVIVEVEGREHTKKDVRKILKDARKAAKQYLPDQYQRVLSRYQSQQLKADYEKKAKQELSWLSGEDNDARKHYESIIGDSRFEKLKKILSQEMPDVGAQLDYWFAHAVNSLRRMPTVKPTKPQSPSLNPTKTGTTVASAQSEKPDSKTSKVLKDLNERYRQTGSVQDFAAMRQFKYEQQN